MIGLAARSLKDTGSDQGQPPPRKSINCNHIAKYTIQLSPAPSLGQPRTWDVPAANSRRLLVPGLKPFTEYCATVTFITDGGFRSPMSEKECVVTPQTIPPAPTNLKSVRITRGTVTVSWQRPDPPNGNVTLYRIMYWEQNTTGATGLEWRSTARYVEYTLTGLQPFTDYQIQNKFSFPLFLEEFEELVDYHNTHSPNIILIVPGQVRELQNVSRTERTIDLKWTAPVAPGGQILHYTVACDPQNTLLGRHASSYSQSQVDSGSEGHVARELSPATQYLCSVKAYTAKGPGPAATLLVWTLAGDPRKPIAPVLKTVTDTTVTIDIHHSGDLTVSTETEFVKSENGDCMRS
ncbi:hypothetical protein ACOMHN_064740 [Nucella lapillus]